MTTTIKMGTDWTAAEAAAQIAAELAARAATQNQVEREQVVARITTKPAAARSPLGELSDHLAAKARQTIAPTAYRPARLAVL